MDVGYQYRGLIWHEEQPSSTQPRDFANLTGTPSFSAVIRYAVLDFDEPLAVKKLLKAFYEQLFCERSYVPSGEPVSYPNRRYTKQEITQFVYLLARTYSDLDHNRQRKFVIGMLFGAIKLNGDEGDLSLQEAVGQFVSDEESVFSVSPASKSSIEALEKKTLRKKREFSGPDQCTICLEGFIDTDEVTCMPCGHEYHGDCIVQWLERSHVCPLCRFAMPTD